MTMFFGWFVGTMVKESDIHQVCISKAKHHKEVKVLCSKQIGEKLPK